MTAWERHNVGTGWHAAHPSRIYLTGPYDPTPAIKYLMLTVGHRRIFERIFALRSTQPGFIFGPPPDAGRETGELCVDGVSRITRSLTHAEESPINGTESIFQQIIARRNAWVRACKRGRVRGATFVVK